MMDIGIPPLHEHVDVPLQGIGNDDLWDRVVTGEGVVCTVCRPQGNDEGGDMIKISGCDLSGGERDSYSRTRHFRRRCRADWPAPEAPAGCAGHDQVLNRFGFVPAADPGEVSGNRVALRAVPSSSEIDLTFLGVANQDIELAWRATIGERLAVQPGGDGGDVRLAQREPWHTLHRNAVLDDRSNEFPVLISEHHLRTDQVRSRLSTPGVRAMAETAIASEELFAMRNLLGRSGMTRTVGRSTFATGAARSLGRLRRARGNLRWRQRSTDGRGKSDDHSAGEPEPST